LIASLARAYRADMSFQEARHLKPRRVAKAVLASALSNKLKKQLRMQGRVTGLTFSRFTRLGRDIPYTQSEWRQVGSF
jgi:hypothetical protein